MIVLYPKGALMKKVLVIEDDVYIRESVKELLEEEGFQVMCAANGKEALDSLNVESELPELILLDLMMPVMDGYDFCKIQESDPRLSSLPVVLISADGQIEKKRARIGSREVLKKPLSIDTILSTVERFCGPAKSSNSTYTVSSKNSYGLNPNDVFSGTPTNL